MRDTAAVRRWFAGLALLDQLHDTDRDVFADHATWVTLPAGERLHAGGQDGAALCSSSKARSSSARPAVPSTASSSG
jgi:hypothetical protein